MVPPVLKRIALAGLLLVVGCSSRADVREWTPEDHDQDPNQPGIGPRSPQRTPQDAAQHGAQLVDLAWDQNCTTCHGREGKGDGPQGPMLHATDLTAAAFQAARTDDQMVAAIRDGKGKMPKFNFPPELALGLVKRIRLHKAP